MYGVTGVDFPVPRNREYLAAFSLHIPQGTTYYAFITWLWLTAISWSAKGKQGIGHLQQKTIIVELIVAKNHGKKFYFWECRYNFCNFGKTKKNFKSYFSLIFIYHINNLLDSCSFIVIFCYFFLKGYVFVNLC